MGDKKSQALYTIIFEDESTYNGGTIFDTKWLDIPTKKIKRIFYRLPGGNFLCLGKYDKYFHYIEAVQDITGTERGKTKLEYAYIMGKKGRVVTSYRITLFTKKLDKYRQGDITVRYFDFND